MLFTKLKLNYFGKFQNREIELKPGINLIYGDNEAGKSTIHTFIRGMLFGIERSRGRGASSKEDIYMKYLPWDYPGAYSGSMDIQIENKEYRLQRSFHANDKNFTLMELSTGREVKLKDGRISELIPGLTEGTFKNTISIEQLKAQTDTELAAQVRNYITNLSITKSNEVDVAKAVSLLTQQRKQLETILNTTELKDLQEKIEEGIANEEKIDRLTIRLRELQKEEQQIVMQKNAVSGSMDKEEVRRMEQLPAILEKFRIYQDYCSQCKSLEEQLREMEIKVNKLAVQQQSTEEVRVDIIEARKLQSVLLELEQQEAGLHREKKLLNNAAWKNGLLCFLPAIILACIILGVLRMSITRLIISAVVLAAGTIGYVLLHRKNRKQVQNLALRESTQKQNKTKLQARIRDILLKYKVSGLEELSQKQEELLKNTFTLEHAKEQEKELTKRKTELEDNCDVLYDFIMKYLQYFIPDEELTEEGIRRLSEAITEKKRDTFRKVAELNRQQEGCRISMEKVKWEMQVLEGNEDELFQNREEYKQAQQKQMEAEMEREAVWLALSTIQELSSDIHDSFGQQLNNVVSEMIGKITGQKYSDLKVNEKLEVKLGWNSNYILFDRLSTGTIEQVYFALRLAIADLLLGKDKVPLLLDDSFAYYDDTRVRAAFEELEKRQQVILFTCHKREQTILEKLGFPYHLVDLSCG